MRTSGPEPFSRCWRLLDFPKKALRRKHFLHGSRNSLRASVQVFSRTIAPRSPPKILS
jgi:hypothetical protein